MAAYATELTREWSLKELGYDMTIRDEESDKKMGFYVKDHQVMWNDFSGSSKNIPVGHIIEKVSMHFPERELFQATAVTGHSCDHVTSPPQNWR